MVDIEKLRGGARQRDGYEGFCDCGYPFSRRDSLIEAMLDYTEHIESRHPS